MLFLKTSTTRTDSPPKKERSASRVFLSILFFLFMAVAIFTWLSPVPISLMIRAAFNNNTAVPPKNYEELKQRVTVVENLCYPSEYRDNEADIYIPKDRKGPFPVVLWIHGGAFVGGDKEDVKIYATALAAEGFAVVCMNYRRAPEAKYPVPIIQTGEVYQWIRGISGVYSLDINRFFLAGDSAGAHIAAQFAAVQSNADYAAEMGFGQIVPLHTLRAALLFCGPFDVAGIGKSSNAVINVLMKRAAWAYFGTKGFNEHLTEQATISNCVTSRFPPVFITDGNYLSFEEHGRNLADTLDKSGVFVETYFISADFEKTGHEYQFIMNTPAGEESFLQVIHFLKKHINDQM